MQAIIDIILNLAQGSIGYFSRGDPAAWDFVLGDFTVDSAWHSLDLSAFIPENTRLVLFTAIIRNPAIARYFAIKENGQANDFNSSIFRTQVANTFVQGDLKCSVDADRKIEYLAQAGMTFLSISIRGWWL